MALSTARRQVAIKGEIIAVDFPSQPSWGCHVDDVSDLGALLQDVNGPPQAEQDRADRPGAFT